LLLQTLSIAANVVLLGGAVGPAGAVARISSSAAAAEKLL
jgi:hypothetical protein